MGTDYFDDAGVFKLDASTAIVQTLDFFPPLVDDPYIFGQIAAANALSDVYAMGGKPLTTLNIVGFPDDKLPIEMLGEILQGGAERVIKAGAVMVGGHTVRDGEIKYGLSVTGLVHPDKIITNAGAKVGDAIVLSKPIGTGILTSAAKSNKIKESDLDEAVSVMIDLNAGACEAMLELSVQAATDITGFGLVGHASEMAVASDVTIEIETSSVPLLQHTLELAGKKQLTRAYRSNMAYLGDQLRIESVDDLLVNVLADAQTSGGLLMAISLDRVDALLSALNAQNTKAAVVIGAVSAKSSHRVVLK